MFKDKLKELREKAGLSQQALADKLFVSRSAVAKWENGNGIPSDVNLEAIYELFNVTYDDLFGEEIINEYREVTKSKFNYKKLLLVTIIISSIIILSCITLLVIDVIHYDQFKQSQREYLREIGGINDPVSSFGEVPDVYLNIIDKKILEDYYNVFIDIKYIYTIKDTSNNDIIEIIRYDYNFNVINQLKYFVNNGYSESIGQIKTTSDDGIVIVCNHSTYYEDDFQYRGYSKITKLDKNYQLEWEHIFTNGENNISDIFENNNKFYVFAEYSNFSNDYSSSVSDIIIYTFDNSGKIIAEKNVTSNEWGNIDFVLFEKESFYVYGWYQPINEAIFYIWEYNLDLELVNKYKNERNNKTYKSSSGLKMYDDTLIINNIQIPSSYGKIKLCLKSNTGYLLVFNNCIDVDWDYSRKHPYVSFRPMIYQTVYLYMDLDGNIVWCKSV